MKTIHPGVPDLFIGHDYYFGNRSGEIFFGVLAEFIELYVMFEVAGKGRVRCPPAWIRTTKAEVLAMVEEAGIHPTEREQ